MCFPIPVPENKNKNYNIYINREGHLYYFYSITKFTLVRISFFFFDLHLQVESLFSNEMIEIPQNLAWDRRGLPGLKFRFNNPNTK
jgi:hypothetical protein